MEWYWIVLIVTLAFLTGVGLAVLLFVWAFTDGFRNWSVWR